MSTQTSPRNYTEAERSGAFRQHSQPSEWMHDEIVQIDLPAGYRCHIITRLNNYQFDGNVFTAETTYLGRPIRFTQVSASIGGSPLEDWKPINAHGQRVRLVIPAIEWKLLTNNKCKQRLLLQGEGILRATIGFGFEGMNVEATRDNYSKMLELRKWLIGHYEKHLGLSWQDDSNAILRAISDEHARIVDAQGKDLTW